MKDVSVEAGSNFSTVKFNNLEIYFSYKTPIAFWAKGSDAFPTNLVSRQNDWGATTGKHLNAVDGGDKKSRISGTEFEAQLAEVLKSFGLTIKGETMLTIIGRRWFEKTNGNTYHSVELYGDDGKLLARVPFAYGYGDQYKQTALDLAVGLGLYPDTEAKHGGFECFSQFVFSKESGGDGNLFNVTDVARKKDL